MVLKAAGAPEFALTAALALKSSDGRSFAGRIGKPDSCSVAASTAHKLSRLGGKPRPDNAA
jgi:hypothetical protein